MDQLSFFDTGLLPVTPADVGSLLLAHGHSQLLFGDADTTRGRRKKPIPQSARISILLTDEWRATRLDSVVRRANIPVVVEAQTAEDGSPQWLVRMESPDLLPVVQAWTKGAVKTVPPQWQPTSTAVQIWATVAGVRDDMGFRLGLDPHIADHPQLLKIVQGALARSGVSAVFVGVRAGGPAVRVQGQRRLRNLMLMVGDPPPGHSWEAPAGT
ncbi:MAG TPA: hypothetical protein GX530_05960 [Corynebacteriales bacterium]|nr:hypothetical protein [Mycobacteriales bacterium]